VIKQIPLYSEMHRFIPAMASMAGARIVQVRVRHHARRFGLSKYGLSRIYKVLFDLLAIRTLIASAQRPMAWFGLLAAPALLLGAGSIGTASILTGSGGTNALPLAGVGVLLGALFVFLLISGVLAELLLRAGDPAVRRLPLLTIERDSAPATLPGRAQSEERKRMHESMLSVVIPVTRANGDFADLFEAYDEALGRCGRDFEFLFVLEGANPGIRATCRGCRREGAPSGCSSWPKPSGRRLR
jgi:hypothetical protein